MGGSPIHPDLACAYPHSASAQIFISRLVSDVPRAPTSTQSLVPPLMVCIAPAELGTRDDASLFPRTGGGAGIFVTPRGAKHQTRGKENNNKNLIDVFFHTEPRFPPAQPPPNQSQLTHFFNLSRSRCCAALCSFLRWMHLKVSRNK
jgi:hypothetical protein